jgi:hypothetical protein
MEDNVWAFEKARAIIYGREEGDDVVMEAGRGRFQESKMALLTGGVDVRIGKMRVTLSDIEWLNDERVARSDNPLTMTSEDMHIEASSLKLYPDRKELVLTNAKGILQMGGEQP